MTHEDSLYGAFRAGVVPMQDGPMQSSPRKGSP